MISSEYEKLLEPINNFLKCKTPNGWLEQAKKPENLSVLLRDHLICELKAAQSAMFLIRRYGVDEESSNSLLAWLKPFEDFTYRQQGKWQDLNANRVGKGKITCNRSDDFAQDLVDKMVLLIKEELHHFIQVLEIMEYLEIPYEKISSSRYAKGLLQHVRTHEPAALVDKLICGAFIEARSCERFTAIAPYLEEKLSKFYISLLRSEHRHYQDYLSIAKIVTNDKDIAERVLFFAEQEALLIQKPDSDFKFHSGLPIV